MDTVNKNKRIYLVGFMAAGKTTFGKILAKRLGYNFIDTDRMFEEKYKTSIDLFFKKYGEENFRKLEHEILKTTFSLENTVISTGGGTPCFFNNMEEINNNGLSIYLQLPPKALYHRLVNAKRVRPLVTEKSDDELLNFIQEKLKEREPFYNQSKLIISGLSPDIDFIADIIKKENKTNSSPDQ